MSRIEESIEIDVPVRTAYNQWTQFEEFPRYMDGITHVEQITDKRLHWKAEIAGKAKEWETEITEQLPDKRIAWKSIGGAMTAGVVTFHRLSDSQSKIMLQMEYDPTGFAEHVGDAVGLVKQRVIGDLQRFKTYIENRGQETGAWRGTVSQR